jgi:DNA-binding MarR family transcriptional regulator
MDYLREGLFSVAIFRNSKIAPCLPSFREMTANGVTWSCEFTDSAAAGRLTIPIITPKVAYTTMRDKDSKETAIIAKAMADECIAVRVRFVGRVVTSLYDRALRNLDIKVNQASILVFITTHGDSGPGDIGKALQMEKSTVSRNLDRMRKKGWIGIGDRDEGPSQVVQVTEKGNKLLIAVHREWQKAQESARKLLGAEGVRSVNTLFDTLRRKRFAK